MSTAAAVALHRPLAGIAWMLLSGLLFVCVTGIVRHLGSDMPAIEAAFIRYAIGLALIAPLLRPGFQEVSLGALAQLTAAPLFATSFLLAKKLTEREDPGTIVAMLSLVCTLVLLPGAVAQWRAPSAEEVFWLALTALFATAGHYTLTRAFAAAPLTVTQPIGFLQLVWAALLGMVAFGEALDPWVFAGGGIIVAAATYISHREALAARRARTPPADATRL